MKNSILIFLCFTVLSLLITKISNSQKVKEVSYNFRSCNPQTLKRTWINDSTFIDKVFEGKYKSRGEKFYIIKGDIFYKRNEKLCAFLSEKSFHRKDTVALYDKTAIKPTKDLFVIHVRYIPMRIDGVNGVRVLVYKVVARGDDPALVTDELYFDPQRLIVLKYDIIDCGEGLATKIYEVNN